MGDDFSYFQVYAPDGFDFGRRNRLIMDIISCLSDLDYAEVDTADEFERVMVVGPTSTKQWGLLFDSAAYRTDEDLICSTDAKHDLARALSRVHSPLVEVSMGDNVLLDLLLYADGKVMDQYTNNIEWKSDLEKQTWIGNVELWMHYLNLDKITQQKLRVCWDQRDIEYFDARDILSETSSILEWDQDLDRWTGYTWGMDGIPISYRKSHRERVNEFTELYFRRKPKQRRLDIPRP